MSPRALIYLGLLFSIAGAGRAQTADLLPVHALRVDSQGRDVRLWLALFKEEKFDLRVIDNATPAGVARFANLGAAMRAEGAVAGCNASFFDRDPFAPVGGMVSDGRVTTLLDTASWMKGVLVVRADGPALENTDAVGTDRPGVLALVQSGPWLVREGAAEADNHNGLQAARTFIGHNGKGGWFLGLSEPCTLRELANLLRSDRVLALVDVRAALNLDGGPSSGLWVKGAPRDFYRMEVWDVRNFIAVVPKGLAPSGDDRGK